MHIRVRFAIACALLGICGTARAQSPLDGFNPGTDGTVQAIAVHSDGRIMVGGSFTVLGGQNRSNIGRLRADGSVDPDLGTGADGAVVAIAIQPDDDRVIVGGDFTHIGGLSRSRIARYVSNDLVEDGFDPGADGRVAALALQADGKILVGGTFTMLGGQPRANIGRLNADGTLDSTFNPGADAGVLSLAVQPDGKIVVGGSFTTLGGQARSRLGRLNADGSLDLGFAPALSDSSTTPVVQSVALEPDGQILVGGTFTTLGGQTRRSIGRLNRDGSVDPDFNPGASRFDSGLGSFVPPQINALALQPDGKILVGGLFTGLGGGSGNFAANQIGRLNPDGSLDAFSPGANNAVAALAVQPDGEILVGGSFTGLGGGTGTTTRNSIGRLYPGGAVDTDLNPGANGRVYALAVQPDGKILVGGDFTGFGGGAGTTTRNFIARLNADGSLDTNFNPGADTRVSALAVQPDGKILVGGAFTMLGGGGTGTTTRNHIGRLNADGSLDTTFDPGADQMVRALAVQPDGKILVVGDFSGLGGGGATPHSRIGRLNADGSLDTAFNPGADDLVYTVAVQADGKILVGGFFANLSGGTGTTTRKYIGRLNADGSIDTGFNPGADAAVYALAVQADGKILVGGLFTMLGGGGTGTTRNHIGRLNADGSLDTTFDPGADNAVQGFAVQPDAKILVGGFFNGLGGGNGATTRHKIGRLNADGAIDTGFDPGANGTVNAFAVQPDGKVLVGGEFTGLGGATGTTMRNFLGRVTNTDAAIQSLIVSSTGSVVAWPRSGEGPDLSRVTFESSADGVTYTSLGNGTRVSGIWQLTGQSLPLNQNLFIRARGYYATGYSNGSTSVVESIRNVYLTISPSITAQPSNQTVTAGANATFGVAASGNPTPGAQWQVSTNGGSTWTDLTNTAPYSGVTTTSLTITGASANLSGNQYRAVATNSAGTATSGAATLTVNALPTITTQPANQSVTAGANATFTTAASGSPTPTAQWQVSTNSGSTWTDLTNTAPYSGVLTATLTITSAAASLSGNQYRVVATNSLGAATSSAAALTVNTVPAITTEPSTQTVTAGANATFTVAASGSPTPTWQWQASTNSGSTWTDLTNAAPYSGVTTGTLTITSAAASLSGNQYRAVATNSAGAATSSGATLTVNTVPAITTEPASQTVAPGATATFIAAASGIPTPSVQWQVSTNGGSAFSDVSGATSTTYAVTVAAADTGAQFRAVFTNSAGTATSAAATLTVAAPTMAVDKTTLAFGAVNTGAAFSAQTSPQTVRLVQAGVGTVTWTAASNASWLVVAPTSGSGSATLTVSAQFASGLAASQSGAITLTFTGAGNTAGPITVTLASISGAAATAPTGAFDTPTDGTTGVTGSIAVTGWAIDDIEVTAVRILRDPIAGEPAGALVLLGSAVLVDGARPDVQAGFPNSPRNTRAGWGYLMLTNFLPGLGNGTFKLTAIADDADGHSTVLGTKTITCTNATATAPTGALDTPAQGGTVSGTIVNFGWVLSPSPGRADPPSGGTVRVVIDGAFISAVPSGWTDRADLTALFPAAQYPGIVNALGVAVFDSTPFANGVHTISWLVTDNLGNASGIGSRYFTVSNGSGLVQAPVQADAPAVGRSTVIGGQTTMSLPRNAAARFDTVASLAAEVDEALVATGIVRGRRGYDAQTALEDYAARDGRITIHSEELDRIELHVGQEGGGTYSAYLRVPGGLAPLPVGSRFDEATREFTWQPGVGFVGAYDVVFVRWSGGRAVERQEVRIILNPKVAIKPER